MSESPFVSKEIIVQLFREICSNMTFMEDSSEEKLS